MAAKKQPAKNPLPGTKPAELPELDPLVARYVNPIPVGVNVTESYNDDDAARPAKGKK